MNKFFVVMMAALFGVVVAGCDQKNDAGADSKASENTPAAKEREAVQQTEAETKPAVPQTGISTTREVEQRLPTTEPVK
ncbi:MAG TPA: hypothetical protein VFE58_04865 [Tepidisphaeraceae bacterium]|jgi:hypothetical protein|nr:hypothetical protein [Tepidisphaeraceae bacterium]